MFKKKPHVFVCLVCDLLADTSGGSKITCSPACKAQLKKRPEILKQERAAIRRASGRHRRMSVARMAHIKALDELQPDLFRDVIAGKAKMAELEEAAWSEYMRRAQERAEELFAASPWADDLRKLGISAAQLARALKADI